MNIEKERAAVSRGATFLDEYRPGWDDWDRLTLAWKQEIERRRTVAELSKPVEADEPVAHG